MMLLPSQMTRISAAFDSKGRSVLDCTDSLNRGKLNPTGARNRDNLSPTLRFLLACIAIIE